MQQHVEERFISRMDAYVDFKRRVCTFICPEYTTGRVGHVGHVLQHSLLRTCHAFPSTTTCTVTQHVTQDLFI
jgi:hypothetical protein